MRVTTCSAAVLLLACGLVAQGDQTRAKEAKAAYDGLVAQWKAQTDAYSAEMKKIQASEEYKKARDAKDNDAARALTAKVKRPDPAPMIAAAMDLAAKFQGEDRVPFYVWALQNGAKPDVAKTVADKLIADHAKSQGLLPVVESGTMLLRSLGQEGGKEFLAQVAKASPHAEIRANAIYWPAYLVVRNKDATPEEKSAAEQAIAEARTLAEGTLLADRIDGPKFIAERLQIGMEAPDIAGEDVDGVPFKLSDYRGKVVVLDFWGYW